MNAEYNQVDYDNAQFITSAEYNKLVKPIFIAQTRTDENGDYKMYWHDSGILYVTHNNLFN